MSRQLDVSRRTVLGSSLALAAGLLWPVRPAGAAGAARASGTDPLRLTLPGPTGPAPVGTVSLHLIDARRLDPWADPPVPRELMISLWYPARNVDLFPAVAWLPPRAAATVLGNIGVPPGDVLVPTTRGHDGAPVDRRYGRLPVVLFSPGSTAPRSTSTIVVEQLASSGYLVVTVDHPYDAEAVEFPDGRVVTAAIPPGTPGAEQVAVRVADARFALDALSIINAGGNPDAGHRPLPVGLRGVFALNRVGMFGTSMGGATTAATMLADPRVRAGLSLDGPVFGPVVTAGLDRPFMQMDAKYSRAGSDPLNEFWSHLRGWRLNVRLTAAGHLSYSDFEVLLGQLKDYVGEADGVDGIGTVPVKRAVAVQRAYPLAFFDRHLRQRGSLLNGPSPCFPEIVFIP